MVAESDREPQGASAREWLYRPHSTGAPAALGSNRSIVMRRSSLPMKRSIERSLLSDRRRDITICEYA